jgi:hypothetical protein
MIISLLREIEPPSEKLRKVSDMRDPLSSGIDWRAVLEGIWDLQQTTASRSPVATMQVHQLREEWKRQYTFEQFEQKMIGLESLADGILMLNTTMHTVNLRQAPTLVAERVAARLEQGDAKP